MRKTLVVLVAITVAMLALQPTQAQKSDPQESRKISPKICNDCDPPDPPPCLSPNPIDGAQFFVEKHYGDFLLRHSDPGGLAFWTGQITQCGSNAQCVADKRVDVSRAFWESSEFRQQSRTFGLSNSNPPPQYNNDEFVRLAFVIYLQRFPALNDPLFVDRVNRLNSCTNDPSRNGSNGYHCYQDMIREFITSTEYRSRFGCP